MLQPLKRATTAGFSRGHQLAAVAVLTGLAGLVGACTSASVPKAEVNVLESLQIRAELQDISGTPNVYELHTVLTNIGERSIQFGTFAQNDCAVRLRAYDTPARSGVPVWGEESEDSACPYVSMIIALKPGESRTLVRQLSVADTGLDGGTYYLSAVVVVENSDQVVNAGTLVVN